MFASMPPRWRETGPSITRALASIPNDAMFFLITSTASPVFLDEYGVPRAPAERFDAHRAGARVGIHKDGPFDLAAAGC